VTARQPVARSAPSPRFYSVPGHCSSSHAHPSSQLLPQASGLRIRLGQAVYTSIVAELKTQRNDGDVDAFLAGITDERRRRDAQAVCALMREVTGVEPTMWGTSIVGFGDYHYAYASGRSGEWFAVGFSPRKQNLTLYLTGGFDGYTELLGRLGKHSTGKSCLYVKKLADVDADVLRELVTRSYASTKG
jgi:hypothetical protein